MSPVEEFRYAHRYTLEGLYPTASRGSLSWLCISRESTLDGINERAKECIHRVNKGDRKFLCRLRVVGPDGKVVWKR